MVNLFKGKRASFLTLFVMAIFWGGVSMILHSTDLVQDMETRWQKYYYDLRLVFPKTQQENHFPIYVVKLDDSSIPENTCRSPIDSEFLGTVLDAAGRQSPKTVGLHLMLDPREVNSTKVLQTKIGNLDNVVLLESASNSELGAFRDQAKGWGRSVYRMNSSSNVQYVCDDPKTCICSNMNQCIGEKIFHQELWNNYFPDREYSSPQQKGWLKIHFTRSSSEIHQKMGKQSWNVLSAKELLALAPNSFAKDALILIGPSFGDLYTSYRIPLQQLSSQNNSFQEQMISPLELTALVMDMVMNQNYLKPMAFWWETSLLLLFLLVTIGVTWERLSFTPLWVSILLILLWNGGAGLLFTYFSIEVNSILPSLAIFTYSLFCIRHMQFQGKLENLQLMNQLEKERFNHLIDEFHSHSVFNALEQIRYLFRKKDPGAEEFLLNYSSLLRDDLKHDSNESYTMKEQWEYVKNYLNLHNLKHSEKIQLEFSVDSSFSEKMGEIQLPWKLFYPLVENAFKYTEPLLRRKLGEKPKIQMSLLKKGNSVVFQVRNSFAQGNKVAGTGKGLINMKRRLKFLYPKGGWNLHFSQEEKFWISILELPI